MCLRLPCVALGIVVSCYIHACISRRVDLEIGARDVEDDDSTQLEGEHLEDSAHLGKDDDSTQLEGEHLGDSAHLRKNSLADGSEDNHWESQRNVDAAPFVQAARNLSSRPTVQSPVAPGRVGMPTAVATLKRAPTPFADAHLNRTSWIVPAAARKIVAPSLAEQSQTLAHVNQTVISEQLELETGQWLSEVPAAPAPAPAPEQASPAASEDTIFGYSKLTVILALSLGVVCFCCCLGEGYLRERDATRREERAAKLAETSTEEGTSEGSHGKMGLLGAKFKSFRRQKSGVQ